MFLVFQCKNITVSKALLCVWFPQTLHVYLWSCAVVLRPAGRSASMWSYRALLLEPAGVQFSSRTLEQITQGQSVKLLSPGRMYDHRLKLTPDFFLYC